MSSVAVQVENIFVVEYTDIGLTGSAVLGSHVTRSSSVLPDRAVRLAANLTHQH